MLVMDDMQIVECFEYERVQVILRQFISTKHFQQMSQLFSRSNYRS